MVIFGVVCALLWPFLWIYGFCEQFVLTAVIDLKYIKIYVQNICCSMTKNVIYIKHDSCRSRLTGIKIIYFKRLRA